ncbi:MAG: hypothetical protein ACI8VJ_001218, partial [Polaribacter sp.]
KLGLFFCISFHKIFSIFCLLQDPKAIVKSFFLVGCALLGDTQEIRRIGAKK